MIKFLVFGMLVLLLVAAVFFLPLLLAGLAFLIPILAAILTYLVSVRLAEIWGLHDAFAFVLPVLVFALFARRTADRIKVTRVRMDPGNNGDVIDVEFRDKSGGS